MYPDVPEVHQHRVRSDTSSQRHRGVGMRSQASRAIQTRGCAGLRHHLMQSVDIA